MSEHATFEIPSGLPDIVTIGIALWGDPTKKTSGEVRFGAHESKIVRPAPANTWYDHEADKGGGYVDLYKLKFGAMPERPGFPIPPGMAKELGEPVAWWDYHDASGTTVARVVRFHPPGKDKTYRQCRPDGNKWRWKMEGIQIPLYHLPELMHAADGGTVYITEGEKHADQLRAWGLTATTNAGGAKKFRPDHAAALARFNCVILPDNDEAGRAHEAVVVAELRKAGCKTIRVLNLPNLPRKGDIIDWVKAGGTHDAFEKVSPTEPSDALDVPSNDESKPSHWFDDDPGFEPPETPDDPGYHAAQDEAAAQNSDTDPVTALVAEFNQRYMVVNEGGKTILHEPAHDPILNRGYHTRMDFADLNKLYLNRTVENGVDKKGNPIYSQVAGVWLRHPNRRQYIGGVIFDPSGKHADPTKLNLWQGFAVKPRKGSWRRMHDHIREVVCASNADHFAYVINWLARMVQFPALQGQVAIVMKGIEGCGKGTLARAMMHIMGQHSLTISNAKHLTGNFNAHLRDCVFLFADEAFFAGDRSHVGVLKALITEPTLTVEAKYQNAVQTPNFAHIMMASNEDWVIPASLEARRFLMLLVPPTKVRNHAYFADIWKEMEAGGYEAMLHDLLARDLSGFDVADVPDSEGLHQQKKLSLPTAEAWWLDVLHRGYVYRSKLGLEEYFSEWQEIATTDILYASYAEYAKARNERRPMEREIFGQFMRRMGGAYTQPRNAVVGEHITDVPTNAYGDTIRKAKTVLKNRATGYQFGILKTARDAFQTATNLTIDWEEPDDAPA